jgi:putative tryptophan/tyrosine transport system substrate-binding protein
VVDVSKPDEIAHAFRIARAGGAQAVNVLSSQMLTSAAGVLTAAAIEAKLPTICQWRELAEAGCFASYGPTLAEVYRTAGEQVARILQGARIAELPVEQPTRF